MVQATRNYLTLDQNRYIPTTNGEKIEITLNELISSDYIKPVLDPKTKQLVDIIRSKVTVTKVETGFNYEAVIVSPTCGNSYDDNSEIVIGDEEEMLKMGWITLHLYYPESSTERKWRLGSEGELRSDPMLIWQDYTGPITIPLVESKMYG